MILWGHPALGQPLLPSPWHLSSASSSGSFTRRRCFPTALSNCPFSLPSPPDCNLVLKWILTPDFFDFGDIVASYHSGSGILPAQDRPSCQQWSARAESLKS